MKNNSVENKNDRGRSLKRYGDYYLQFVGTKDWGYFKLYDSDMNYIENLDRDEAEAYM